MRSSYHRGLFAGAIFLEPAFSKLAGLIAILAVVNIDLPKHPAYN